MDCNFSYGGIIFLSGTYGTTKDLKNQERIFTHTYYRLTIFILLIPRPEEHIDVNGALSSNPRQPDCTAFMDLEFSMHAFEHLEVNFTLYHKF